MTQTINHSDPAVAALQESVRHNEQNIDLGGEGGETCISEMLP